MATSISCIATTDRRAEQIITDLVAADFVTSEISVVLPDIQEKATKTIEKTAEEAATGIVAGGILGLLAGWSTLALAVPGVGPFLAAGPIISILGALGGTTGAIVGGLIGLGIPEREAQSYEAKLRTGHYFICVHPDRSERIGIAKKVFEDAGATDTWLEAEKVSVAN